MALLLFFFQANELVQRQKVLEARRNSIFWWWLRIGDAYPPRPRRNVVYICFLSESATDTPANLDRTILSEEQTTLDVELLLDSVPFILMEMRCVLSVPGSKKEEFVTTPFALVALAGSTSLIV